MDARRTPSDPTIRRGQHPSDAGSGGARDSGFERPRRSLRRRVSAPGVPVLRWGCGHRRREALAPHRAVRCRSRALQVEDRLLLAEQRFPQRCKTTHRRPEWLEGTTSHEEKEAHQAHRLDRRKRHGRPRGGEHTATGRSRAWNQVASGRATLRALGEIAKDARRDERDGTRPRHLVLS